MLQLASQHQLSNVHSEDLRQCGNGYKYTNLFTSVYNAHVCDKLKATRTHTHI